MRHSKRGSKFKIGSMTGTPIHQQQEDQSNFIGAQPFQPNASSSATPNASSSGCGIKKIRGPTVCSKIWSLPATQCIQVSFNKHGQPDGPNVSNFTNFLGTIAQNGRIAPLTYTDWRALPKPCKDDMWTAVREKFDVNHGNKDWVLKSIGKKWKDWKSELKLKRYETHTTNEERLKDLDIRVVPKQWSILVSYWNSLEGMERCKIGKHNRALQRLNHTAGSKSFARIFREKTDERFDGEEPSRTDIFIATHTRDEQPMDEASAEIISKLHERVDRLPLGSRDPIGKNDTYGQVMGEDRHGYEAFGALRSVVEREQRMQEQMENMEKKYQEKMDIMEQKHKEQMDNMEKKYEDMGGQYKGIQAQLDMIISNLPSNMVGGPTVPMGTKQVPYASSAPSTSQNQRIDRQRPPVKRIDLQQPPAKKPKMQNMSTLKDGGRVRLMSIYVPEVCVALGTVRSMDPSTLVGGVALGPHFWEVYLEIPVVEDEPLIRPHGRLETIKNAIGCTIA